MTPVIGEALKQVNVPTALVITTDPSGNTEGCLFGNLMIGVGLDSPEYGVNQASLIATRIKGVIIARDTVFMNLIKDFFGKYEIMTKKLERNLQEEILPRMKVLDLVYEQKRTQTQENDFVSSEDFLYSSFIVAMSNTEQNNRPLVVLENGLIVLPPIIFLGTSNGRIVSTEPLLHLMSPNGAFLIEAPNLEEDNFIDLLNSLEGDLGQRISSGQISIPEEIPGTGTEKMKLIPVQNPNAQTRMKAIFINEEGCFSNLAEQMFKTVRSSEN